MQHIGQKKGLSWATFWQELVKLDFISNFFTWLMEFLARVTEPLAAGSAIYIIIVAGVPQLFCSWLYTLTLALIIGSPELVVVGAFKIASREIERKNRKGWWLMAACLVLLLLTALTVSDLFMWHWSQDAVNILMGFRCLAGIGYSFTRGIVTGGSEPVFAASSVNDLMNDLAVQFTAKMQQAVNQVREQTLFEVNQMNRSTLTEINHLVQGMRTEQSRVLVEVNQVNGLVRAELNQAAEVLSQQSQAILDAAIERVERAQSQRLQTVYQRLEQVTVSLAESNPILPAVHPPRSPRQIPARSVNQEREPGVQVPGESEPDSIGSPSGESKVNQGRRFTLDHYQASGSLPSLAMIMAQVACSKTLASRAYNLAKQELARQAAK